MISCCFSDPALSLSRSVSGESGHEPAPGPRVFHLKIAAKQSKRTRGEEERVGAAASGLFHASCGPATFYRKSLRSAFPPPAAPEVLYAAQITRAEDTPTGGHFKRTSTHAIQHRVDNNVVQSEMSAGFTMGNFCCSSSKSLEDLQQLPILPTPDPRPLPQPRRGLTRHPTSLSTGSPPNHTPPPHSHTSVLNRISNNRPQPAPHTVLHKWSFLKKQNPFLTNWNARNHSSALDSQPQPK